MVIDQVSVTSYGKGGDLWGGDIVIGRGDCEGTVSSDTWTKPGQELARYDRCMDDSVINWAYVTERDAAHILIFFFNGQFSCCCAPGLEIDTCIFKGEGVGPGILDFCLAPGCSVLAGLYDVSAIFTLYVGVRISPVYVIS